MEEIEYFERIKKSSLPVIVDFWAPWCGPCKSIEPLLEKLGKEYAGRVEVWKVNIDESRTLKTTLHILGIPTLIVYKGGREVTRCTGAVSLNVLTLLFETALLGAAPTQPMYLLREQFIQAMMGFSRFLTRLQKSFAPKTSR